MQLARNIQCLRISSCTGALFHEAQCRSSSPCLLCFWSMLSWTTMYGWCSKFCVLVPRQAVGLAEADCGAIEWRKGGRGTGPGDNKTRDMVKARVTGEYGELQLPLSSLRCREDRQQPALIRCPGREIVAHRPENAPIRGRWEVRCVCV